MSRSPTSRSALRSGFPRVSGDEPTYDDLVKAMGLFSPREWG